MKRAIETHGQCEALTKMGYRCGNAAYKKGRCTRHMPKATHSADGERVRPVRKPACKPQTGAGVNYVFIQRGDDTLEVKWSDAHMAFEVRSTHKGMRDGLCVFPASGNLVYIKVGEML